MNGDNVSFTTREYDVVVFGGGISGVCVAVAADRYDARVALIQNRPVLGGNASSEVRMHICGADYHAKKSNARETGIVEEILLDNRLINPQHSFSVLDTVLWEKVTFQENLDLFLNTHMTDVTIAGEKIVAIKAEQMTSERRFSFKARNFVDTSGDAVLAYRAGADIRTGREARHEYDEKLAPREADNVTMGNTLMFESKDMGHPVYQVPYCDGMKNVSDAGSTVARRKDNQPKAIGCAFERQGMQHAASSSRLSTVERGFLGS